MRTGTSYVANQSPEVIVSFLNISLAAVGVPYANYALGGTQRRLLHIDTKTEPYTCTGTIRLLNQDQGLNGIDFRGCQVVISWGWHTGTPSIDEPYWVISQSNVSSEGKLVVELQIAGAWDMLSRSKRINAASAANLQNAPSTIVNGQYTNAAGVTLGWPRNTTVRNIINAIISDANGFLGQWGLGSLTTLAAEPAGAFAIQTYQPWIITRVGIDDQTLLHGLIQMTHSALTFRNSTGATLNYIDPTNPGPYYNFNLPASGNHPFFINLKGDSLTIPNRVLFADREPDPVKNIASFFVGSATDATSISQIGNLSDVFFDPTIGEPYTRPTPTGGEITAGNLEAAARASAMLARLQAEGQQGEIYVPMNTTAELYDEIQIADGRSGQVKVGRIGRITRLFDSVSNDLSLPNDQRSSYSCHIFLGGIGGGSLRTESFTAGNDIDAAANDLRARGHKNPFLDTPQHNDGVLSQHYAPLMKRDHLGGNNHLAGGGVSNIFQFTIPIAPVPSVLKVSFNAVIAPVIAPAIGDYVVIGVILDSTLYGVAAFVSERAASFGIVNRTYMIPYPADGATHTLTMYGQQHSAGGTYDVTAGTTPDTDFMYELVSAKNATLT